MNMFLVNGKLETTSVEESEWFGPAVGQFTVSMSLANWLLHTSVICKLIWTRGQHAHKDTIIGSR